MILKAVSVAAVLLVTDATAGEIVWRSPVAGVLPYVSDPVPTEPGEPTGLGIRYPALSVTAGKSFSVSPAGVTGGGYEFATSGLPAGVVLSPDGRLVGGIAAAGAYTFEVLVKRGGDSERVSVSIAAL